MPFSKTYDQLLLSLPLDLQDNVIKYHELKAIINLLSNELSSLGLTPKIIQELINPPSCKVRDVEKQFNDCLISGSNSKKDQSFKMESTTPEEWFKTSHFPKMVYELAGTSTRIMPQLRLWVNVPENKYVDGSCMLKELTKRTNGISNGCDVPIHLHGAVQEIILPLIYDTEFFSTLSMTLESGLAHLNALNSEFFATLDQLSHTISHCALPASATSSFRPHSKLTSDAGLIHVPRSDSYKSDLNAWREIFQMYLQAEVFDSVGQVKGGHVERTVEESEKRLNFFTERVTRRGVGDLGKFKFQESRKALETFVGLNLFILNIKKFSHVNMQVTRNLLKKHTDRTSLPFPTLRTQHASECFTKLTHKNYDTASKIAWIFVQAIGETLLRIIPHLDDYTCPICMSIAFKPIRLNCGHVFCVRCLVKMQKRNQGHCPMCRAPCVLSANNCTWPITNVHMAIDFFQANVDWALLNFMQDWFPMEAREKLKASEKEATQEELREWRDQRCVIM